jgi:hypothetical protein
MENQDTPLESSEHKGHWVRRVKRRKPVRLYIAVIAAIVLVGSLTWKFAHRILHPPVADSAVSSALAAKNAAKPGWQTGVADALDTALRDSTDGSIIAAEMEVDRAADVIRTSRIQKQKAGAPFFELVVDKLNTVAATHPEDQRLFEHVTQARMDLASLRSVQPLPASDGMNATGANSSAVAAQANTGTGKHARPAAAIPGLVIAHSPRTIAADHALDPASLGGNYIDARLMASSLEILMPPAARMLSDNVRVENLTLEGAAQTIDGIHWKNVTFIGVNVRYEGGELDLQNVHFMHCTFGFETSERGARLANAIATGQPSITIE